MINYSSQSLMHIHKINLEYSVHDWLWKIIELFIDYQLHKLVAYGSWLNQETKGLTGNIAT